MSPATSRRRGTDLTEAIYAATLAELARTGFAELSFDRIAAVAGTGKAALYRRWSSTGELVLAALTRPGETPSLPGTGTLRGDLIALLTRFAALLEEPYGKAMQPLIAYRYQHPELFEQVWAAVFRPARNVLLEVLTLGATRGEADPDRITERVASIGPQLLLMQAWRTGPLTPADIAGVVDEILLPLLGTKGPDRSGPGH